MILHTSYKYKCYIYNINLGNKKKMSNIELSPEIVNEIEFYVSSDLDVSGLSISGVARLAGVDRKTISQLVNLLDNPGEKMVVKSLQPFVGKVFTPGAIGVNNAKIVNAKAASRIIRYYAYESKQACNEIAKNSYDKFAEIGIDNWIKNIIGISNNNNNTQVIEMLSTLIGKVDRLETVTTEYNRIRGNTSVVFPNLDKMLEDLKEQELPQLTSGVEISLNQWLLSKGMMLDRSSKHRLSLLVSETYKTTTGKKPHKKTIKLSKGRYQPNTCVYKEEEFPILEMSLRKLLGII